LVNPVFNVLPLQRRPCCARTSASFRLHSDLSVQFARFAWHPQFAELRHHDGFSFNGWDHNVVVCSWEIQYWKLTEAHGWQAWPDLLHAAIAPCFELRRFNEGETVHSTVVLFRRTPRTDLITVAILARVHPKLWKVVTCYRRNGMPRDEQVLFIPLGSNDLPEALGFRCDRHELLDRDQHHGAPKLPPWPLDGRSPNPGCCEEEPTCRLSTKP